APLSSRHGRHVAEAAGPAGFALTELGTPGCGEHVVGISHGVLSSVSKAMSGPAARGGRRHRETWAPCTSAASITGRTGRPAIPRRGNLPSVPVCSDGGPPLGGLAGVRSGALVTKTTPMR